MEPTITTTGMWVMGAVGFFLALLYLLPTYIAFARSARSRYAIFFINLLLGMTMIGWIAALVWSMVEEVSDEEQPSPDDETGE